MFLAVLLGATLATPSRAVGQTPDLRFQRLAEPGLSHNSVYAIAEDATGFVWIGTADGLNRYDGYDVLVYRHDPGDPTSLPANVIYDLEADPDGGLWVATANGLGRFDPAADRFTGYRLSSETSAVDARDVYRLFFDSKGTLWAGTDVGLFRYERQTDLFAPFLHDVAQGRAGASGAGHVVAAREDPEGRLWLLADEDGTWALWRVGESGEVGRFEIAGVRGGLFAFHIDRAGGFWLDATGPARVDVDTQRVELPTDAGAVGVAWAFHESRDGIVWIGAEDGLYRFDPATSEITHHYPDPVRTAYIFNHVRALYEDRSGTLWVGTHGGLYRADPHAKPFRHVAGDPENPRSLSSRSISAAFADGDALWLGTYGAGLNRLDRRDGSVERFRHDPDDPTGLRSDIVWAIHRTSDGTLWIGTGAGLCRLDPRTGGFSWLDLPPPPGGAAAARFIRDIDEDPSGRLWLTAAYGLYGLDPTTGAARLYTVEGGAEGAPLAPESVLAADPENIWIGMASGDLARFDPARGTFDHYPLVAAEGGRLRSEGVWDLHLGADGGLWLGTGSGLSRFDPDTGTFRHYFQGDGLPGSVVYGILEDASGRLWLGTNAGLSRFDPTAPAAEAFRNFDGSDGIGSTEFNRRAAFAAGGEFFFGGLDGLTSFDPDDIHDNPYVPPVVLTRIEIADRERVRARNPRELERLVLSHRDYSLSFEIASLSYTNPHRNRYSYLLEGFDERWIDAGTRRFVRYTNVPPGDYVLRVRGSNGDGVWNLDGAALPITVTPPFWATLWFRAAAVLLVVAVLVLAYRVRVGRLLEIERMRLRIAGDLHDDLSTNLSAIALMGEMVQRETAPTSHQSRQLARISETARGMVESLRDIVWLVDPAHDQLDDVLLKMKDLAVTLLDGTECDFRSEGERFSARVGLGFRRQVFLIYKEILHNIARHARATSVSIEVAERAGRLELRVTDDGVGFDPEESESGFGLRNMRERARELEGRIEIDSAPGAGTRIELVAPIT